MPLIMYGTDLLKHNLSLFAASELDLVFCGEKSGSIVWTEEEILRGLIIGNGFSPKSSAVQYFMEILTVGHSEFF